MRYEYSCQSCGRFEIQESMLVEHKANCPKCNQPAQRLYSLMGWTWDNPKPLFHKDGSYEEKY